MQKCINFTFVQGLTFDPDLQQQFSIFLLYCYIFKEIFKKKGYGV